MGKHKNADNYHLSLSDLFCSVLFIFIILLVYFIIQFNEKKENLTRPLDERSELLKTLKKEIEKKDIKVIIDENDGILRIPIGEKKCQYFKSAEYEISECGKRNFDHIKEVFKSELPRYAYRKRQICKGGSQEVEIDTILIEGHSDSRPLRSYAQINCPEKTLKERKVLCGKKGKEEECTDRRRGRRKSCIEKYIKNCLMQKKECVRDNFHLSTMRAREAFKYLLDYNPKGDKRGNVLYELYHCTDIEKNKKRRIFGVSGFGESRPIGKSKAANRRIDFRFIMPTSEEIKKEIQEKLNSRGVLSE